MGGPLGDRVGVIHRAHAALASESERGREERHPAAATEDLNVVWVSPADMTLRRKAEIPVMEVKVVYL